MKKQFLSGAVTLACLFSISSCVKVEWRGGMTPSLKWNGQKRKDVLSMQSNGETSFREETASSEPWPDFRGPRRNGIAPSQGLRLDWAQAPTLLWRQPAGEGHSSVIVVANRIYTIEQKGDYETLTCRALKDGSILWEHRENQHWRDSMGGIGPRSTPTFAKGKIHFLTTDGKLICLDATSGKPIWSRKVLETDYEYPHWGLANSPLVTNEMVIVAPGGQSGAVTAYEASTGEPRWTSELKGQGVYLSPSAHNLQGDNCILAAVEGKLAAIDATSGKTLWEHPWKIFMVNAQITQPIGLAKDLFLLSAGYGKGAAAIQLEKTEKGISSQEVWKSKNLKTKFSSPVVKDGYVYGFNESSLTCLNAATGELQWRGKKYGYGRILLAEEKLLVLGNTGKLSIIDAQPDQFNEIASLQILGKERCWNGPALVGGYLVVRNGSEIACYDWAAR